MPVTYLRKEGHLLVHLLAATSVAMEVVVSVQRETEATMTMRREMKAILVRDGS
jgi:hypothetical protein